MTSTDILGARPALEAPPLLTGFLAAGVLSDSDTRLAVRLGAIAGEHDPRALLAAALALRAPRHGHVCVDIERVAQHVAIEPGPPTLAAHASDASSADREGTGEAAEAVAALDWPQPAEWLEVLRASALVRDAGQGASPLVLDGQRLYLDRYWAYERQLTDRLADRAADRPDDTDPAAARHWLDALFGPPGERLDRQRLAAAVAATRRLAIVAGGPGTGKTYTVTRILALLQLLAGERDGGRPLRVALAAPTGKAAARMQESLREALDDLDLEPGMRDVLARTPASTIHRLLGSVPGSGSRFRHGAEHPLPQDLVIVDEASMVSLALMAKLVDAVRPEARLVLVGDRDQLASVEAGAVFGDVCGPAGSRPQLRFSPQAADELSQATGQDVAGSAAPEQAQGIWDGIVRLDRFHRFGEGSSIAKVAAAIQRSPGAEALEILSSSAAPAEKGAAAQPAAPAEEGAAAQPGAAAEGVVWLDPDARADARAQARSVAVQAYTEYARLAVEGADARETLRALGRLRVLCALRRGPDGVHAWNEAIEAGLGEAVAGFAPRGDWYVGRPVLVTENDYGVRLHNGDVGVILDDPRRPGRRVAVFEAADGTLRTLSPSRLPACETTFAMTIHKSQGSQFDHAVVVLPAVSSPVLTRELVYTALTRAREQATLLASEAALREAVARPVQRASGIADRLWR